MKGFKSGATEVLSTEIPLEKDILCLQVAFPDKTNNSDKWNELLNQLKNLNHKE